MTKLFVAVDRETGELYRAPWSNNNRRLKAYETIGTAKGALKNAGVPDTVVIAELDTDTGVYHDIHE